MAARISSTSLASADWKASAEPSNWVVMPGGRAGIGLGLLDRIHRRAQRIARRDVEGEGGGGELAQVIDLQRRRPLLDMGDRPTAAPGRRRRWADRCRSSRRPSSAACGSASRITRYWLDWVKMVEMMRWPKAVIERIVDRGRGDAEARRGVAVHHQIGRQAVVQIRWWRHCGSPAPCSAWPAAWARTG